MPALFRNLAPLVLASASPRRQKFLADLGLRFSVMPASIDETPVANESAEAFALRMAREKAVRQAAGHSHAFVISADTVVTLRGTILGKPRSREEALATLSMLQGTTHQVITGLCLCCREQGIMEYMSRTTSVEFSSFDREVLMAYVRSDEPMDKAGAYGIQGRGAFLVRTIKGSCSNVIGLPVSTLVSLLLHHRAITPVKENTAAHP